MRPWYFQPRPKVPWTFLLLGPLYTWDSSESVKKTSVIGLPKFTIATIARKCHQHASFSKENLFFKDCSFGSLMTDVFLDWFWTVSCISIPQKQESPWNYWSRLKILEAHCVSCMFVLVWRNPWDVCNVFWLAAAVVGNIEFQMDFSSSKSLWIG